MAAGFRNEKSAASRDTPFGRGRFLRATLALLFVGVTLVLAFEGVSIKSAAIWLVYLAAFIVTDQVANVVLNRIARQQANAGFP